jgi:hypothetical protein
MTAATQTRLTELKSLEGLVKPQKTIQQFSGRSNSESTLLQGCPAGSLEGSCESVVNFWLIN